jgi:hypothetical protein
MSAVLSGQLTPRIRVSWHHPSTRTALREVMDEQQPSSFSTCNTNNSVLSVRLVGNVGIDFAAYLCNYASDAPFSCHLELMLKLEAVSRISLARDRTCLFLHPSSCLLYRRPTVRATKLAPSAACHARALTPLAASSSPPPLLLPLPDPDPDPPDPGSPTSPRAKVGSAGT